MRLYQEDGQIYFDYTDVNVHANMDDKTINYRRFMLETQCWEDTDEPQVVRMVQPRLGWATAYGNACELRQLIGLCVVRAKCNSINVEESVDEISRATAQRCDELKAIEVAKEAELKAKAEWDSLCKYGCGRCENKRRDGDDYFCKASGDMLPEKNMPGPCGKIYQLFNYTAFPTENCPYNIKKNKEITNV